MSDVPASGFLLVDKESGWTSHDVVAKIRRHAGGKVGHAGTLDPMATGLLAVGIRRATRLLRFVQGADKEYEATALLGVATDSLDADGAVLSRAPMPVTEEDVCAVLERFRGESLQVPPMVSARKVEGRKLYELAREGKVVEREARPIRIEALELTEFAPSDYPTVSFRIRCSTGTYIRTLADDIARAMGGRAHLTKLRRTRIGALEVEHSTSVGELVVAADDGALDAFLIPPTDALASFDRVVVDEPTSFRVRNGRPLPADAVAGEIGDFVRVCADDSALIAVYRRESDAWKPEVVIA